jgi:hypothetical protein
VNNPVWTPARSNVPAATEIPIALPARGIPGLVLNDGAAPEAISLAVLDTGATFSAVTPRYVEANHLETSATSLRIHDAKGNIQNYTRIAHVNQLKLGSASLEAFDALVDELPALRELNRHFDALLAAPLFHDVLLTIDYPGQKLIVEQGSLPEPNGKTFFPCAAIRMDI